MATIKELNGNDSLKTMYPKVNENFTALNGQVNNLVLGEGDNTDYEVVDARYNQFTTETYLTLKDRLDTEYNEHATKMGDLPALETTDKTSLVKAINEVNTEVTKPEYSPELTNETSIFSTGTGKQSDGSFLDVNSSVEEGQVSDLVLKANTRTNIADTFDSDKWSLHANVTVDSPIKITLNATTTEEHSDILIGVKPNTTYAFSGNHNGSILILTKDSNGNIITVFANYSTEQNLTFTTDLNASQILVRLTNKNLGTGTYIFENIMVEETDEVKPFIIGTKSTISVKATSVGKNLLDKNISMTLDKYITTSGSLGSSTSFKITDFIKVKESTNYYLNFSAATSAVHGIYDINKNFIGYVNINNTFTIPSNGFYIRLTLSKSLDISTLQLEKGTTETEYEPFKYSEIYTPPVGNSLPNGTKDEVNVIEGKKYQRNNEKILQASDITEIVNGTNNAYAKWSTIPNDMFKMDYMVQEKMYIPNKTEIPQSDWDKAGNDLNKYATTNQGYLMFTFPLNTTLTEAQNDLAGTSVIYQLAEPIVTDINVTPLQAYPNGTIYTEAYLIKDYNITGTTITLDYPVLSLDKLQHVVDGELVDVEGTLSSDGATITVTEAGTYHVEAPVRPEESTIPTTVHSVQLNKAGQTDQNTVMIQKVTDEFNQYKIETDAHLLDIEARLSAAGI